MKHTNQSRPWIGVDLDGTLAHYDGWVAPDVIGEPIPAMVERVKRWLAEGRDVRIFTARICIEGRDEEGRREARLAFEAIRIWCREHLGRVLPITCMKDLDMIELWDDRAVQVEHNTGRRADGRE